jgi:hypothetical protein
MKPADLPPKSDEVPEAVHEKYMDWIIEQQLEISKLLTVVHEQQQRIKLLESQVGNVESELPQLKSPHRRLGFLYHLRHKRFALIAATAIFVLISGSGAWLLMERQVKVRRVNLSPTPLPSSVPAVTVIPPSPASSLGESGEKVRSPDEAVTPPVIAQIPNRREDVKVVEEPKVTDPPRVNRPTKRKIFVVNERSFLRSKPEANADVIATLSPGSRIEITKAGGEYFRVRALDGDNVSGFVHKEDAFFEPMP